MNLINKILTKVKLLTMLYEFLFFIDFFNKNKICGENLGLPISLVIFQSKLSNSNNRILTGAAIYLDLGPDLWNTVNYCTTLVNVFHPCNSFSFLIDVRGCLSNKLTNVCNAIYN